MSKWWLALVACLLLSTHIRCDDVEDEEYADQDRALLVLRKYFKESPAVQGRNVTVAISVYNAGASSALSVEIQDADLPETLKLVAGSLKAKFERIPVGSNVTHEYVVVPVVGDKSVVLSPATIKYQAEMESEDYQVGASNIAGTYVLTPAQKIQNQLLITGSYLTLGMCKSTSDWRNLAIVVFLITILLGGNWSYKKVTSAKQKWNREKNLKDFGVDSEDESSKRASRKAKKTAEEKEN